MPLRDPSTVKKLEQDGLNAGDDRPHDSLSGAERRPRPDLGLAKNLKVQTFAED
jgi:hypothetical protein